MNCGNNEQCSKSKVQKKNDPTEFFFYSELEILNNDILNLNKIKFSQLYFFMASFYFKAEWWGNYENF